MRQNKNVRNWIEQKELWELRPKPDKIDFQKLDKISSFIEPFFGFAAHCAEVLFAQKYKK